MNSTFLVAACVIATAFSISASPSEGATTARVIASDITVTFPKGTQTPSEECGVCHRSSYSDFKFGIGRTAEPGKANEAPAPPAAASAGPRLRKDGPSHAAEAEAEGIACGRCHNPDPFTLPDMEKPIPPAKGPNEAVQGMTCATCHLTPEGKIRGPYNLRAPHDIFADVKMRTSLQCEPCHALGKKVPGKQTQTYYEWRDDYFKTGLGTQNCQGCHMPRTLRKLTDDATAPQRVDARHIGICGKGSQRLPNGLALVVVQPRAGQPVFEVHVTNVAAGHSVPTGSVRRAVYLSVEAVTREGAKAAAEEWLFAPWLFARPDDRKHVDNDRKLPYGKDAALADAQGPHEAPVRAGEERILLWKPTLTAGTYTIRSRMLYDDNRFNDRKDVTDQREVGTAVVTATVAAEGGKATDGKNRR